MRRELAMLRASLVIAWLTGCRGWALTIGSPELVACATWDDVGMAEEIDIASVLSTFSGGEPDLVVGPVEHQAPARLREVEQVERLDRDLDVLQRGHVEGGDEQHLVGLVERLQGVLVEGGQVSTTTKSKCDFSRLRIRPTRLGGMLSLASGWTGATRAES